MELMDPVKLLSVSFISRCRYGVAIGIDRFFGRPCHAKAGGRGSNRRVAVGILGWSRRTDFIGLNGRPTSQAVIPPSACFRIVGCSRLSQSTFFAFTNLNRMYLVAVCAFIYRWSKQVTRGSLCPTAMPSFHLASIKYHLQHLFSWKKSCELSFFEESSQNFSELLKKRRVAKRPRELCPCAFKRRASERGTKRFREYIPLAFKCRGSFSIKKRGFEAVGLSEQLSGGVQSPAPPITQATGRGTLL